MKEYTLLAVSFSLVAVLIDRVFKTKLFRRKLFYLFLGVIFCFKLLVNGFLTGKEIVVYNSKYFLGLRLGSIPLEDFLFGFSMVVLTIVFWEYCKKKGF